MLHDDNAWLDIFLHCEGVQFHLGFNIDNLKQGMGKIETHFMNK
jgi:hypothetical protein